MSYSGNLTISFSNCKPKLFLSFISSLLLISTFIEVVVGVNYSDDYQSTHAILKSSCSTTFHQELCYSTIVNNLPNFSKKVTNQKDVIELSLNITTKAVQRNYYAVNKLIKTRKGLTQREEIALHDCLETIDETLDELHEAVEDLEKYPNEKSLRQHADDLKTLISAAITNQETCLDGFSHDEADKKVRKALLKGQKHVEKLLLEICLWRELRPTNFNGLNTSVTYVGESGSSHMHDLLSKFNRKLNEDSSETWPEWLSGGDRKLLQSSTVKADVVVAADGSGNYKTVAEAVARAPEKSNKRYVIKIKAGVYRENVEVPKKKKKIMFMGDGRENTIITGNRNVKDGSTTFHSATVAAVGEGFLARDITFENTAGSEKHQAVALRVGADLSAFYRCDMLGYQDTLYVHSNRQFFVQCFISGTVDFIFGNAAAVLQDCDIHARRPGPGQKNMVTAQGRMDPNQNTGIVIHKCRIGAALDLKPVQKNFPTYLGRPWKEYSRTVIMQSSIAEVISPVGWHEWNGNFALSTLFYGEYQNTGVGARTTERVKWKGFKVITSATEAQAYTPNKFITGNSWLSSTGFPFALDL